MTLHSFINIILLLYILSFPLVISINKVFLRGKNKRYNRLIKYGRKIHPLAGIALIVSGALHGYNKLGSIFIIHTGPLLLAGLFLTGLIGYIYKLKKKRPLARLHVTMGLIVLLLFLIHYFLPWFFT